MRGDTVLARAYGGEPLRRVVWDRRQDKIMLINPDYYEEAIRLGEVRSIGFPEEDVFTYDELLHDQLREAFDRSSWPDLEILWTKAKPYSGEWVTHEAN